ncbi:MAG: glycosyltransferase family 2 protein [Solirubrobacteraceae bacterium]
MTTEAVRPLRETPAGATLLEVVIVAAVTGGRELLRDCLSSLERHPLGAGPTRVWVVDNSTRDGVTEMLDARFPWVRVLKMDRTASFSKANNAVLRNVAAPYALLLNPDTEILPGALDRALEDLRRRPERAVVGVRLVRRDGTFDHAAKRSFPTLIGALGHFSGLGRRTNAGDTLAQYRAPELDDRGEGEVDAVNGAFMLVRVSAMKEVGLLDEGYILYGEDLDWCFRFKAAGWTVWYDGGATVVHVKGATTVQERGRRRYRGLRLNFAFHHAMARYYRKFLAGRNRPLDALVYAGISVKFVVSAMRSAIARRRLR